MKSFFKKISVNLLSLILTLYIVDSLEITKDLFGLMISAIILSVFLDYLHPILNIIMMPINLITFNFFRWFTFFLLMYLWSLINPYVKIKPWNFTGFTSNLLSLNSQNLSFWQTLIIISILLIIFRKLIKWISS